MQNRAAKYRPDKTICAAQCVSPGYSGYDIHEQNAPRGSGRSIYGEAILVAFWSLFIYIYNISR